jgi:hypothetical protein
VHAKPTRERGARRRSGERAILRFPWWRWSVATFSPLFHVGGESINNAKKPTRTSKRKKSCGVLGTRYTLTHLPHALCDDVRERDETPAAAEVNHRNLCGDERWWERERGE